MALQPEQGCGVRWRQDVKAAVDQLLAHMEVAAEKDMDANRQGAPAVCKLKMLPEARF